MIHEITTISVIHFITAFAAIFTFTLLWKFRNSTEVKYMIYVQLLVTIWSITYALEFSTPNLEEKILWAKLSYLGISFLPTCYFLFATSFSQKRKYINTRNIFLLLIIPIITLIMVTINEKHLLVWSSVTTVNQNNMAIYHHGPWFWVFFAHSQIMLFSGLFNLVSSIYQFSSYYKKQIGSLLAATIIPIIGNFMYIYGINQFPGFDWTPISFVFSGLIIANGIVKFRMFDIVPFAKSQLFDVVDDGVIVINADGFVEDGNNAAFKIFGFQNKSAIHKPFEQLFIDFPQLIDDFRNNQTSVQLEVRSNNQTYCYQVRISPIFSDKKQIGSILLIHDITSLMKNENELRNMNIQLVSEIEKREKLIEDLDSFAHTVAHDLRNSLSSIFSASEIMEEIIRQNDKNLLFELSNMINHSANKSIQITQELLMLATTDKTQVERTPLEMSTIFSDAKKQLSEQIQKTDATIKEPTDWPVALGYAPWIEEVWTNYLSNAIKYGGTPPVIEVGADVLKNGNITFWIKDNGQGLTADEQRRLFKNFVRLNPNKADGYGLGLTIAKKIIEKLGVYVGVESTGDGNGSKLKFTLPTAFSKAQTSFKKLHEGTGFGIN